jgi:hypothetical protein
MATKQKQNRQPHKPTYRVNWGYSKRERQKKVGYSQGLEYLSQVQSVHSSPRTEQAVYMTKGHSYYELE